MKGTLMALSKDEAEAAKAEEEAEKLRLDNEDRTSALGRAKRDAEFRAAIAKANNEVDTAADKFSSLIPNFSDVGRGETTLTGDATMFASGLALHALDAAAADVAKAIKRQIGRQHVKVLITTDSDLASSDGAFLDVDDGLGQLTDAAKKLLAELDKQPQSQRRVVEAAVATGALKALAGAVPSLMSLLAAKRAIKTQPISGDDLLAAMQVAAALAEADPDGTVLLDDFRVLQEGKLSERKRELLTQRDTLAEKLIEMSSSDPQEEQPATPVDVTAMKTKLVEALIKAIDGYAAVIHGVPNGAKRSPWTTALLRESLHNDRTVEHVVLVKGCAGSAQQLVDDRPLWFQDKFSSVASMGVSYVIVKTEDGAVLGGGIESASRAISGTIGSQFTISPVQTVSTR